VPITVFGQMYNPSMIYFSRDRLSDGMSDVDKGTELERMILPHYGKAGYGHTILQYTEIIKLDSSRPTRYISLYVRYRATWQALVN